jgi:hypothetical protein
VSRVHLQNRPAIGEQKGFYFVGWRFRVSPDDELTWNENLFACRTLRSLRVGVGKERLSATPQDQE